ANNLIRGLGSLERPGVNEDVTAIEHEGVEAIMTDDPHRDAARAESRRAEDRLSIVVQKLLDLGIADEAQALRLCRARRGAGPQCEGCHGNRQPASPGPKIRVFLHGRIHGSLMWLLYAARKVNETPDQGQRTAARIPRASVCRG